MSLRHLKHHESKLLKKVDFLQWKNSDNLREAQVIRRYHIQKREDYVKYNRLVGFITKITHRLKKLDSRDAFRVKTTASLLEKLYSMGLISTKKSLVQCDAITASAFCRRRLAVILVRLKMAETMKLAVGFIEGGHIRVGPEVIQDPAFLVTRTMEDFVSWTDNSKIREKIEKYNDKLDDYTMLGN